MLLEDYDVKDGTTVARRSRRWRRWFCPEASERRTGNAPSPELAAVLTKTVEDAKALASERQVQMKVATTQKALADAVGNIRGAVMIAYPMGLPDYDAVRQILEEREAVDGAAGLEELEIEKAVALVLQQGAAAREIAVRRPHSPRAIRRAVAGARNSYERGLRAASCTRQEREDEGGGDGCRRSGAGATQRERRRWPTSRRR